MYKVIVASREFCSAWIRRAGVIPEVSVFEKISSWLQSVVESKTFDEAITNFISTKYGQYALIFIFFMFIITYLRVLFGPKGFFREKQWDEWNEEAKAAREAEQAECDAEEKILKEKKPQTVHK